MSRTQLFIDVVSGRSRGPFAYLGRILLGLASGGYALAATLRNFAYDKGLAKSSSAGVPVVSIGNITTGGTGKTPMVEYVARHFRGVDLRVAILSRGYGSEEHGGMNDEGLLLDQNLPDVPHLQGANRSELAQVAVNELESEVLILDDGLQHRRLKRSLNIVLIDATNPFGFGWVLPRGLLREPLRQGLKRADILVLTRSDLVSDDEKIAIRKKIQKLLPKTDKPWVESVHRPLDLIMAQGEIRQISSISGLKATIFCGLGNPSAFRRTIEALGVQVVDERTFPDHHHYSEADIASLSQWVGSTEADLVLTSQKDLVKLPVEHLGRRPLGAIRIGLDVIKGESELIQTLNNALV